MWEILSYGIPQVRIAVWYHQVSPLRHHKQMNTTNKQQHNNKKATKPRSQKSSIERTNNQPTDQPTDRPTDKPAHPPREKVKERPEMKEKVNTDIVGERENRKEGREEGTFWTQRNETKNERIIRIIPSFLISNSILLILLLFTRFIK